MNIEFEVKLILREGLSPESKADKITEFATFKKDNIIQAIRKGGKDVSEIYGNLLELGD